MDRCEETLRLDCFSRPRRSLSVESLLPRHQILEENTVEAIELLSAVPLSNRTSDASDNRDLQQGSHHLQVGLANMADPPSNEQRKFRDASLNEQEQFNQSSNDEQTQTGRESSHPQKAEARKAQGFRNDCESTQLRPLLATGKMQHLGRAGDWIWEIVSMVVAVCCLLAIFITLAKFNRQEQPNWPYARTLNISTLIALLATILRSLLENVLAAGEFVLILLFSLTNARPHNDNKRMLFRRNWPAEMAMVSNIAAPA